MAAGDPLILGQGNASNVGTTLESDGLGLGFSFPLALYVKGLADATAVKGDSDSGVGLDGQSNSSVGIQGISNTGTGIVASSDQGVGLQAGSVGREGISATSQAAEGIRAVGADVGVYASGQNAALRLEPAKTVGAPTLGTHKAGELMLDAKTDLYLCKVAGTPGTWKKIG